MSSPGPPASSRLTGEGPLQPASDPAPPPAPTTAPVPYMAPGQAAARRRWRRPGRRLLVAAIVVAVAAGAAIVVLVERATSQPPASTLGPLRIQGDVALRVTPSRGACDTTFTFVATGSVAGTGRMVYRWEQSDGRQTPELAVTIDRSVGSFALHQSWRIEGSQQVDGAMTFRILKPTPRIATAKIAYSCS